MSEAENLPATTEARALTPMELLDRAIERGADVTTMQSLMDMQERWEARQARKAFDAAMAAARAEMPIIEKNRQVDFTTAKGRTNYKYEDLAEIARVAGPILARHGLSYRFRTASLPDAPIMVTCVVSHRLGYSEENSLHGPRDDSGNKNSIQAIGSTLTYLQRMTLKAALGLAAAEKDDDGTAAGTGDAITDDQVSAILDKITETEADIERFCKYMGVTAVADIRQRDFKRAMDALGAKAKTKGGK